MHDHYKKDVSHLQMIDVYRVVELFKVPAGPIDHAVKKLLCAGGRGHKDLDRDIQDVIDSLQRWQEMRAEDERMDLIARNGNDGEHYPNVRLESGEGYLLATTNPNKL